MAGSKRERDLHRAKIARQEKEAAAAAERRRKRLQVSGAVLAVILIVAIIGGVAVAVGSSDDDTPAAATPTTSPTATSSASAKPASSVKCEEPSDDEPKKLQYDSVDNTLIKNGRYDEKMITNCGEIVFDVDSQGAPKTAAAITFLSDRDGYYNNTTCHRLTTAGIYVLQCGDPKGDGTGGPGFQLPDENLPEAGADGTAVYERGTVAMANAGPGTTGSQFFLVYKDSPLPPNYTVIGHITEGMEILDKVAKAGVEGGGTDGTPNQTVKIEKMVSSVSYDVNAPNQ